MGQVVDGRAELLPGRLNRLREYADRVALIAHGVGLSLGSHEGMHQPYLTLLDALFDVLPILWHSEHLGFCRVDGHFMGTLLSMPATHEALDLICARVDQIQNRYEQKFLVENVASVVGDPPVDYSKAGFMNEIVARTGCGLLLDVYNLECDAHNHGLDIGGFLDELNLDAVVELHLARGDEHGKFLMDVHSRRLAETTLALARSVVARTPNVRAITYELLPEAIPLVGYDGIAEEMINLRRIFAE
jgi:hypothetical protein